MAGLSVEMPDWDEPRLRLIQSLRKVREYGLARQICQSLLQQYPDHERALLALGGIELEADQPRSAISPLLRACGSSSRSAASWEALGLAFLRCDQPKMALMAQRRAWQIAPDSLPRACKLVDAAVAANQAEQEAARLSADSRRNPLDPMPHIARGLILERIGLLDPAIDALEVAVALAPAEKEPIALLAGVLSRTSRVHLAEAALRKAAMLDPGNPRLKNDHAAVLMRLHRHAEARLLLQDVLEKNGPHPSVLCNLANAMVCLGDQDEGVRLAEAAIALDPSAILPRRSLSNTMPYQDGANGAALLRAASDCAAVLPRGELSMPRRRVSAVGPLTVGLLSGTLRTHPVGWLTVAGLEHLDPDAFQIICLSRPPEPNDPISRRYQALASSWETISALDDDALARRARALRIDIVIDLGGHGDAARMTACARRLAPVQIKWVGMQNHSTGLPEMDWFLTDRWETPPALESLYSEKMLRMPDGYVCYSPPPHAPDVGPVPASKNGYVTFGCFNNIAKITDRTIATWSEILRALPTSRLILKTHQLSDGPTAERFRARFADNGVEPNRIETRGSSPHRAFLASYNEIDIVLDPFPYTGGLTTCEALWMGVPTVTLSGDTFASRHSTSHLSNAGFGAWVAKDATDYVAMAVDRASRPEALEPLRKNMRSQVQASPLCDAPRFGRALSRALRHAWSAS